MRRLLLFAILSSIFSLTLYAQVKWPAVKYRYAKAYLYNLDGSLAGNHKIIKDGALDTTVTDTGKFLHKEHLDVLKKLFTENLYILSNGLSNCYIPHHAIVYYDDKNKPIASLSVCFMCQAVRFYYPVRKDKPLKLNQYTEKSAIAQLERIKQIFLELGYPVFNDAESYKNYQKNK
jgi:hypothetical protein